MRRRTFLLAGCLVAACAAPERQTASSIGPTSPAYIQNTIDTDGLPDLIVDAKATQQNWVNRTELLPANFCSVEEGNITPASTTCFASP